KPRHVPRPVRPPPSLWQRSGRALQLARRRRRLRLPGPSLSQARPIRLLLLGAWSNSALDRPPACSYFVLMSIETLGEAYRLSWRVRVRCVRGYIESPVRIQPCGYQAALDMQTLVWAKGPKLGARLMCPACGSR